MNAVPYTPQASTHTGDEVALEVRRSLGDTAGTLFSTDDVLAWINAGQREIAQQVDLFGKASIAVVAGQSDYVIDVELAKRVRDIQSLVLGTTRLEPISFQQAQEEWMAPAGKRLPDAGQPTSWYQYNRTVTLVPTPDADAAGSMTIYFSRQTVPLMTLSSELDIPDSHFNALVMYVHGRAYMLTQEESLAATAMGGMQSSIREQQARERRGQINTYPAVSANEDVY